MKPVIAFTLMLLSLSLFACSSAAQPTTAPTDAAASSSPTLPAADATTPGDTPTAPLVTAVPTPSGQASGVTTDIVNVRAGPGITYTIRSQLKEGDPVTIIGKSADGLWWQTSGGWVSATYIKVNGDASGVPVGTPAPMSLD